MPHEHVRMYRTFQQQPTFENAHVWAVNENGVREVVDLPSCVSLVNLALYDPLKLAIRYTRASERLAIEPEFQGYPHRLYEYLVSCPSILHGLGYVVVQARNIYDHHSVFRIGISHDPYIIAVVHETTKTIETFNRQCDFGLDWIRGFRSGVGECFHHNVPCYGS